MITDNEKQSPILTGKHCLRNEHHRIQKKEGKAADFTKEVKPSGLALRMERRGVVVVVRMPPTQSTQET